MNQLKVFLLIFLSCLLSHLPASAQTLEVRGFVSDIYGEPIPGVNVLAKGTAAGTFTDIDGNFSLETSASAVLEFSALGFKTVQEKGLSHYIKVRTERIHDSHTLLLREGLEFRIIIRLCK